MSVGGHRLCTRTVGGRLSTPVDGPPGLGARESCRRRSLEVVPLPSRVGSVEHTRLGAPVVHSKV